MIRYHKKREYDLFGEEKMSIGLVVEGGAMRGMYTAGVIDVFLDNQIDVDGIVGVSADILI